MVGDLISVSHGDGNLWSIELTVKESQSGYSMDVTHNFGGKHYTPDDLKPGVYSSTNLPLLAAELEGTPRTIWSRLLAAEKIQHLIRASA